MSQTLTLPWTNRDLQWIFHEKISKTENRMNMAGAQGVWRSFPVMSSLWLKVGKGRAGLGRQEHTNQTDKTQVCVWESVRSLTLNLRERSNTSRRRTTSHKSTFSRFPAIPHSLSSARLAADQRMISAHTHTHTGSETPGGQASDNRPIQLIIHTFHRDLWRFMCPLKIKARCAWPDVATIALT